MESDEGVVWNSTSGGYGLPSAREGWRGWKGRGGQAKQHNTTCGPPKRHRPPCGSRFSDDTARGGSPASLPGCKRHFQKTNTKYNNNISVGKAANAMQMVFQCTCWSVHWLHYDRSPVSLLLRETCPWPRGPTPTPSDPKLPPTGRSAGRSAVDWQRPNEQGVGGG